MVSFWGSNKADNSSNASVTHNEDEQVQTLHVEPTERTRLLQSQGDGFLDPDDPAVTPMNLWSVKVMRFFTVLFLVVTFIWWIILLVAMFVTPPGLHSRGSGFLDFSYTTLSFGVLLALVIFFTTPSNAQQASSLTLSIILLVDMILIVAVPQIRHEEGWVGIFSVVWALLMSIWSVLTDRTVAWGKREEEERLTGRPETRRTLTEWLSVLSSSVIGLVLIAVSVLLTAVLIIRARDASLPAPGQKYWVDGGKYQVHLACVGNIASAKTPTLLIEAGEKPSERSLEPFINELYQNGSVSRYCYWDRPGFGWSDNGPSPLSAGMASEALAQALSQAGETGNMVLLSAGIGSIYSRVFSSRRGNSVKGLLLIDPLHEDYLPSVGSSRNGFFLWAYGVISPLGLERIPGALFGGRTREDRVYGRSAIQGGKYIKAKLQENLVASSLTSTEVVGARAIQSKDTPLAIISSGTEVKKDNTWSERQKDLTTLTENLVSWTIVDNAPHQVWETAKGRKAIEKALKALLV